VESNPGPVEGSKTAPKTDSMRQTRLSTAAAVTGRDRAGSNNRSLSSPLSPMPGGHTPTDFTLADLMTKLNSMDTGMNSKLDGVLGDVSVIKERMCVLQEEVGVLRKEVDGLKAENEQLKHHRDALWTQLDKVQRKVDDLEGRSKRENLIFYGMDKENGETNETLELRVKELLTDKLEIAESVEFDRVHRISNKPNSPVIAKCTFYKDKVKILKLKNKLRGTNTFIGEDYSQSVRDTRKKLTGIMKTLKGEGKNVKLVFDHLFVDGKKMFLSGDGMRVEER
jgi:chromosome segregation ATPase